MWQPIETAPKDGTRFVAWQVTIMDEYDDEVSETVPIKRGVRDESPCIAYWFSIQGLPGGEYVEFPYRGHVRNRTFTHWHPLPAPPTAVR